MQTNCQTKGNLRAFLKAREKEHKNFRALLKKRSAVSPLIAENEAQLTEASAESIRAFKKSRDLPLDDDGVPCMYRLIQSFLSENGNGFTQKKLKEFLFAKGVKYGDEELLLLPPLLIAASAESYLQTGEDVCLKTLLGVCRSDFSEIFFLFSKIEKIFMSEAAGVYASSTAFCYCVSQRLRISHHKLLYKLQTLVIVCTFIIIVFIKIF